MNKVVMCVFLFLFISCQKREKKYFYYRDYRNYIHEQFFVASDKEKAIQIKKQYMNLGEGSIYEFNSKYSKGTDGIIRSKKEGEIIRYYPELSIVKVLFRFTNEELNVPARMDVRKRKFYVPMLLMHDTLPRVDTVKYIPD